MSMAHDYRHKNDMTGSSSVPNLDASDPVIMSPQRSGPGYQYQQHQQHQQQQQHHHYGCSSRQQQMGEDPVVYPHTNLQANRSRSVPSVAAAVAAGAPTMDPYSSHTSLYGPGAMEGHHQMGHDNRGDYSCDNFYGDKTFSTFRSGGGYNKPCYANGRCQSRQKAALVRQASAGSLPPDHHRCNYVGDVVGGRGASSAYNLQHAAEDLGYKSDGEGYKSDGGGCYRGCASAGPQSFRNQPYPQAVQSRPQEYYNQGGTGPRGDLKQQRMVGPRNGYVSDGEGYLLQQQNRRVTRSGKYGGSHTSSPGGTVGSIQGKQ